MKLAYGPIHSFHAWEPPAPVKRAGLSPAQCRALVTIFFAGEMNRARQFFIADGCETVYGTTVDILHRKGLVKLGVERRKRANFGKIMEFRYFVSLTPRGEWYATTLVRQREANVSALELDNFEDSQTVYAEEPEKEVEAIE